MMRWGGRGRAHAGWLAGRLAAALVVAYAAARVALALAIIPQHTTHRPIAHRAVRLSLPVPLLSPPVILSPKRNDGDAWD